MFTFLGSLVAASMFLSTYVPHPILIDGQDVAHHAEAVHSKRVVDICVYSGVFLIGLSYIYFNGKSFVDQATRFV